MAKVTQGQDITSPYGNKTQDFLDAMQVGANITAMGQKMAQAWSQERREWVADTYEMFQNMAKDQGVPLRDIMSKPGMDKTAVKMFRRMGGKGQQAYESFMNGALTGKELDTLMYNEGYYIGESPSGEVPVGGTVTEPGTDVPVQFRPTPEGGTVSPIELREEIPSPPPTVVEDETASTSRPVDATGEVEIVGRTFNLKGYTPEEIEKLKEEGNVLTPEEFYADALRTGSLSKENVEEYKRMMEAEYEDPFVVRELPKDYEKSEERLSNARRELGEWEEFYAKHFANSPAVSEVTIGGELYTRERAERNLTVAKEKIRHYEAKMEPTYALKGDLKKKAETPLPKDTPKPKIVAFQKQQNELSANLQAGKDKEADKNIDKMVKIKFSGDYTSQVEQFKALPRKTQEDMVLSGHGFGADLEGKAREDALFMVKQRIKDTIDSTDEGIRKSIREAKRLDLISKDLDLEAAAQELALEIQAWEFEQVKRLSAGQGQAGYTAEQIKEIRLHRETLYENFLAVAGNNPSREWDNPTSALTADLKKRIENASAIIDGLPPELVAPFVERFLLARPFAGRTKPNPEAGEGLMNNPALQPEPGAGEDFYSQTFKE